MATEAEIRPARPADRSAIDAIVRRAYEIYVSRMAKRPGPMLDDYGARIDAGQAWVLEAEGAVRAVLILIAQPGAVLLDNLAVDPDAQRRGYGTRLARFAEAEARRRGCAEIRLYTHETMTENLTYYARLGYRETSRGEQAGYARVFMAKRLDAEDGEQAPDDRSAVP